MNLYARLAQLARYQPARTAILTQRTEWNYAEFERLARRIAHRLRLAGVGEGDVVGVRLRETPEHMATLFAIMRLGAITLPLDWRGTRKEFERVVGRFAPRVIVNDDKPPLDWVPKVIDVATLADTEPEDGPPAAIVDAPLAYSLTSGTTGEPKAVVVTHEQLLARCFSRSFETIFAPDDRFLNTLPLAYLAGREHATCAILVGATLAMFPPLFEPAELVAFVNGKNITAMNLSPNMTRALLAIGRADGEQLMPNLRRFVSTTGKLQPEERIAIRKRISGGLLDYYGSTATGPIAVLAREEDERDPTAVGRPVMGVEVGIADDAGNPVVDGEPGRIRVRGPGISTRLVGDSSDAREGFRDGWFYPGDLGYIGPNGILHLEGRSADLIKRGGLMVHAQEVEQALRRHPSITDAAVVGAPSADLGQEVVAFVVASPPPEVRELVRHCRSELAPYKIPARFVFTDLLPRNANGKVVKAELLKTL